MISQWLTAAAAAVGVLAVLYGLLAAVVFLGGLVVKAVRSLRRSR